MKIYLLGDIGYFNNTTNIIMNNIIKNIHDDDIIFLLGDNFYPSGVSSFEDIRWDNLKKISNPIYAVLGNHDYLGDINIQIKKNIDNWNMINNYYMKNINNIDFFFIDTSILIPNYSNLNYELVKSKLKKEPSIVSKNMIDWLNDELKKSKNMKIVIGHYPILSYGMYGINKSLIEILFPIFKKYGVNYYISGHDHNLQIIDIFNEEYHIKQIISGSTSCLYPILKNSSEKVFCKNGYVVLDLDSLDIQIFDINNSRLYSEPIIN